MNTNLRLHLLGHVDSAEINVTRLSLLRNRDKEVNLDAFIKSLKELIPAQLAAAQPTATNTAATPSSEQQSTATTPVLIRKLVVKLGKIVTNDFTQTDHESKDYQVNYTQQFQDVTSFDQVLRPLAKAVESAGVNLPDDSRMEKLLKQKSE